MVDKIYASFGLKFIGNVYSSLLLNLSYGAFLKSLALILFAFGKTEFLSNSYYKYFRVWFIEDESSTDRFAFEKSICDDIWVKFDERWTVFFKVIEKLSF